jgi:hypothetical protein
MNSIQNCGRYINRLLTFQDMCLYYIKQFVMFFETKYESRLFILLYEDVYTLLAVRNTTNKLEPEFYTPAPWTQTFILV